MAGLVAKCTCGTLARRREVKADMRGLRGRTGPLRAMSRGPGTKTKWVAAVRSGKEAMRSARASKFSGEVRDKWV